VPLKRTVPQGERWTITEKGRKAADETLYCVCDVRLNGILFTCPDCGTVYGSMREAHKPRAQRWNYGR